MTVVVEIRDFQRLQPSVAADVTSVLLSRLIPDGRRYHRVSHYYPDHLPAVGPCCRLLPARLARAQWLHGIPEPLDVPASCERERDVEPVLARIHHYRGIRQSGWARCSWIFGWRRLSRCTLGCL
jgi:hypothetical protein